MAERKLINGERHLIQTVDKKLSVTTHRVIKRRIPWTSFGSKSIMLEDITGWEAKVTGKSAYLYLSMATTLLIYFNDSFALLSTFFLLLYFMTRQRRVHVKSAGTVMILPVEIDQNHIDSLFSIFRQAHHSRIYQLRKAPQPEKATRPAAAA